VEVRPDPLTASLGLPTKGGRLVVDEHLTVPGHPEVFAYQVAETISVMAGIKDLNGQTSTFYQYLYIGALTKQ